MDDPVAWFAQMLRLPGSTMLPAVAVPLARMEPDEAAALWAAWREYALIQSSMFEVRSSEFEERDRPTPNCEPRISPERAARFASILRRGVETAVCTAYAEVAWVAVGEDEPDGVPESGWELLLNDTPLTASIIRLLVHAGDAPVIVHLVQRRGERVPKDERGPFRLP